MAKKTEWLVEDEDSKRRIVLSVNRPTKGKLITTTEEEGYKRIIVSKVIGRPGKLKKPSSKIIKRVYKKTHEYKAIAASHAARIRSSGGNVEI